MSNFNVAEFMLGLATGMVLGALIINVVLVSRRRRHVHLWSPWTDWTAIRTTSRSATRWDRVRRCRTCGDTQTESAGEHTCIDPVERCPHYKTLAVTFDEDWVIRKMERDAGVGGNG